MPARVLAAILATALAALGGCAPAQAPCPPGLSPMRGITLYFGGGVPDPAWHEFSQSVLTPAFPDGFTVFDAGGQWRNPADGAVVRERSRVVQAFGATPVAAGRVAAAYRVRFRQMSVGIVSQGVCAAF